MQKCASSRRLNWIFITWLDGTLLDGPTPCAELPTGLCPPPVAPPAAASREDEEPLPDEILATPGPVPDPEWWLTPADPEAIPTLLPLSMPPPGTPLPPPAPTLAAADDPATTPPAPPAPLPAADGSGTGSWRTWTLTPGRPSLKKTEKSK